MNRSEAILDTLRGLVQDSLLPGAEMPGDDEGIFGRVDPELLDKGLKKLRQELPTYVPIFSHPHRYDDRPPSLESLQLLAPLWPRADAVRKVVARKLDNPSINSTEASIRRQTYILSHVPGHESQAPARKRSWAIRRLALVVFGPFVYLPVAAVAIFVLSDFSCAKCPPDLYSQVVRAMVVGGPLLCLTLVSFQVLPGVFAVAWNAKAKT